MPFNAQITINDSKLYNCFKPEEMDYERGHYIVKKRKNQLIFDIHAKDPVALKTMLNAICKLIEVKEKIGGIK